MKLVQKDNVQLSIKDDELNLYLNEGFKEVIIKSKEIKKVEEPKKIEK